jgi:hypothetical protein
MTWTKEGKGKHMSEQRHHTPGPWTLDSTFPDPDGYKVRGGSLIFRKGPRLIAIVKNQGDSPITEDHLSDARLIAAAPDLLEALKDCVSGRLGGQPGYVNTLALTRAEAAIRKAEEHDV